MTRIPLKITDIAIGKNFVQVPIHPDLVEAIIDPKLPYKIFPQAFESWKEQLAQYVKGDVPDKDWIRETYIDRKPVVRKGEVSVLGWKPFAGINEAGPAGQLALSGISCTCLCIDPNDSEEAVFLEDDDLFFPASLEKRRAYCTNVREERYGIAHVYKPHNVYSYPEALMLGNWCTQYLNEALHKL
jgi:hypothetical protein